MEEYAIRKSNPEDVPRILELTRAHSVTRNSVVPGFLEFPIPSHAAYLARIKSSTFCYVATANEIVGFLLTYPRSSLEQELVSGPIVDRLLQRDGNFVYLEQVAVKETHHRKGIAQALFDRCLSDAKETGHSTTYGATSHAPIRNTPLIKLLSSCGFQHQEEITFDSLTFGLYSRIN